jgi:hypothetical protein
VGRLRLQRIGSGADLCRSFPTGHGKWQISNHGGEQPKWRWDGKEFFYIAADRTLTAVPVKTVPTFEAGSPAPLFATNVPYSGITDDRSSYTPSHDGQRFIINTLDDRAGQKPFTVIVNWLSLLK